MATEPTPFALYLVLVAGVVLLSHRRLRIVARARGSAGSQRLAVNMHGQLQPGNLIRPHVLQAHAHAHSLRRACASQLPWPGLPGWFVLQMPSTGAHHGACVCHPTLPPSLARLVCVKTPSAAAHRVVRQVRVTVVAVIARHGCCCAVPAPLSSAAGKSGRRRRPGHWRACDQAAARNRVGALCRCAAQRALMVCCQEQSWPRTLRNRSSGS